MGRDELSWVRGVGGRGSLSRAPPFSSISCFPQGSMAVTLGAEEGQFGTGLDFQNICNILFVSLPLGKRSGFCLNSILGPKRKKIEIGFQAARVTA